jgi:hypothetical protein
MASSSTVVGGLLALYFSFCAWTLGSMWYPATCVISAEPSFDCVGPLVPTGDSTGLDIWAFASNRRKSTVSNLLKDPKTLILTLQDVRCACDSTLKTRLCLGALLFQMEDRLTFGKRQPGMYINFFCTPLSVI